MPEQNEYRVLFENKKVTINPKSKNFVQSIYIDMTGWKENKNYNDQGIYSYSADFCDNACQKQHVVCTGLRSGGMRTLLNDLRERCHATPNDCTQVYVYAPVGYLYNKNIELGCVSSCSLQALRLHGANALDFSVTSENNVEARLHSVLDEAVHQGCLDYGVPPKRGRPFEKSTYRYYDIDKKRRAAYMAKRKAEQYDEHISKHDDWDFSY